LAGLPPEEQSRLLLGYVKDHVALVLGYSDRAQLPAGRNFQELGFDSLMGVELRNRLRLATGLGLPATMIFDHPTCESLARHLDEQINPSAGMAKLDCDEAAIRAFFAKVPLTALRDNGLLPSLMRMAESPLLQIAGPEPQNDLVEDSDIESMDGAALIQLALAEG
jgi:hypothetical protein